MAAVHQPAVEGACGWACVGGCSSCCCGVCNRCVLGLVLGWQLHAFVDEAAAQFIAIRETKWKRLVFAGWRDVARRRRELRKLMDRAPLRRLRRVVRWWRAFAHHQGVERYRTKQALRVCVSPLWLCLDHVCAHASRCLAAVALLVQVQGTPPSQDLHCVAWSVLWCCVSNRSPSSMGKERRRHRHQQSCECDLTHQLPAASAGRRCLLPWCRRIAVQAISAALR